MEVHFVSVVDFMSCITVAKGPWYGYGQLKLNPSYTIVRYYVNSQFMLYYGDLPTAMNAILAIIANSGQAIVVIDREAAEVNHFLL